jgi:hypothetical protein
VLRPGRLVPGPVRRHHRGRVRRAHLAQGACPDLPAETFTTVACTDDRGRANEYDLAEATVKLGIRAAEQAITAAETARDAALLQLRSPAPGQAAWISNQVINALGAPVEAACLELEHAGQAAAAIPARVPLTAPRRTQALAALCDRLTAVGACYPGTDLVLRYEVKSRPSPA